MNINNIKFLLPNGELDYQSPESLGIRFNRIVDDFNNPSKRYGEFSYTFNLPNTKNNSKKFEFPDAKGRTKIFVGKQFSCKVYNNNELLIDGIIELVGFDSSSFNCIFYSKFTQLIDALTDRQLVDLRSLPTLEFPANSNEAFIANHILADYKNCDQTDFQFPLIYYKTFYAPASLDSVMANDRTLMERSDLCFNYIFNEGLTSAKDNGLYFHQLPPAIYLVSIIRAIFEEAGWTLSGTFFENPSVKRIIIPFTGEIEDLLGASGTTASNRTLNLNKTLPDISQVDFLRTVINAFNLYFTVDIDSKTIKFESHDTIFRVNNDNAYDITRKVNLKSVKKYKEKEPEVQFLFDQSELNNQVAGYDIALPNEFTYRNNDNPFHTIFPRGINISPMGSDENCFYDTQFRFMNKTTGSKKIELSLTQPNYFTLRLYGTKNINGANYSGSLVPLIPCSLPLISVQNRRNNDEQYFNEESGTTFCDNTPSKMKYGQGFQMLYYYGLPKYDLTGNGGSFAYTANTWNGAFNNWLYIPIITGGTCSTASIKRIPVPVASPFKLMTRNEYQKVRGIANKYFENGTGHTDSSKGVLGAEVRYLLMTYYMAGSINTDNYEPTEFSLTFGDADEFVFDNLYSRFHKGKYNLLRNSHLMSASMRLNETDWKEMQINRTIRFDDEFYRLVSIKNYDPVKRSAEIALLKKE